MKIIGASVVFVCDREFRIIRDGGVVYEGERIVEVGGYEELVAKYTKSPSDSKILELESTFLNNAEKIQSITSLEKVDSSCEAMDCHADFQSARNDRKNTASENAVSLEKADSRNAQNLHKQADSTFLSSRDFRKEVVAIHKGAKADSRACGKKADSKEKMDCHATATQRLAMTENNAISENAVSLENKRSGASVSSQVSLENKRSEASLEKVDSRENAESLNTPQNAKAENVFDSKPQAAGFCDDFAGCARRAVGEGIYLSGNEQAHRADSRKSAQNKRSGASVSSQVSLEKPTPKTPKIINACGQTTIPTLLQALQALDLFITNDSGSMHIAAALGVPMVAIFGPTNMLETAPWRARDCALLNLNLPCAPCKKRVCPLGHHKCMKDLRPEMVIEAALAILHKPKLSK